MRLRTKLLRGACAFAAITSGATGVAYAQATGGEEPTVLSDIVVTARKREESLQSVPVAVTTQTSEQLEQQRITQPTDLGRVVPSLEIRVGSGSANSALIALRGQVAGDTLLGISQPVGLYEDNVNIPHPFGANNAFFDVARVEVLKGPQGTLYGRNTTGGAINIITRNADYSGVHGYVEGEIGNFDQRRAAAAVNVPILADVLSARLAYQYWKKDGYGRSRITGQTFGDDKDDHLARLSLRFDPASNLSATLKAEYGKADHNGAMLANRSLANPADLPASAAAGAASLRTNTFISAALWSDYRRYAPLVRNGFFGNAAALGQVLAAGQAVLAPCIGGSIYENCSSSIQFDRLKTWHGVLDVNWDVTETVRLRSITGVHHFDNHKWFDLDSVQPQILEVGFGRGGGVPAPNIANYPLPYDIPSDQRSTQWSQEFNLSGTFLERLDWLVGAYGSWDEARGNQISGAFEELTAFSGQLADGRVLGEPGDDGAIGSPLQFGKDGRNDIDTWALYTQNDLRFSERVSVTFGARYTEERIGIDLADWDYFVATNSFLCHGTAANGLTRINYAPPTPGDPESCANSIFARGPNNLFSRAKFSGTSYLLSFNFQMTPDKLFYAKTARGFRGGAMGRAAAIPAAPEFAIDYELGFKGDFLDRRLRTNLSAYHTNYENKQESSLTCLGGEAPPCTTGFTTTIRNAATARIRGVELEVQAVPVEGLSIWGSGSYTDAQYLDWPGAVGGDGQSIGNAGGQVIVATPEWQANVGARYELPVGPGILGVQADYYYRSKTPLTLINNQVLVPDAVERDMQKAHNLVNGRIDYDLPDMGLRVSLWATNLTDEAYGYKGISAGYTGGVSHMVVQAPRTYGLTVRKTFGEE